MPSRIEAAASWSIGSDIIITCKYKAELSVRNFSMDLCRLKETKKKFFISTLGSNSNIFPNQGFYLEEHTLRVYVWWYDANFCH
jgi:hypothetical protein